MQTWRNAPAWCNVVHWINQGGLIMPKPSKPSQKQQETHKSVRTSVSLPPHAA